MKNTIRRGLCLLLLLAMTAAMAACGQKNTNTGTDEKTMVYAVEAGSAGEEVAKEKGWTVNSVQDQAAALMEVAAGTSDRARHQLFRPDLYRQPHPGGVRHRLPPGL